MPSATATPSTRPSQVVVTVEPLPVESWSVAPSASRIRIRHAAGSDRLAAKLIVSASPSPSGRRRRSRDRLRTRAARRYPGARGRRLACNRGAGGVEAHDLEEGRPISGQLGRSRYQGQARAGREACAALERRSRRSCGIGEERGVRGHDGGTTRHDEGTGHEARVARTDDLCRGQCGGSVTRER